MKDVADLIPGWRKWPGSLLLVLLILTYVLSAAWAFMVPLPVGTNPQAANFQPDEFSHVAVIRYLAEHRALPPYEMPYDVSVHPPLYHGLGALVYILVVPACGLSCAILTIRLLTAFCGVGVVYLTYRAARHLSSSTTSLLAAALVALVPMRASIGGGTSNENLAALGAAGVLAMLIGGSADRRGGFLPWRRVALLAVYLVVGVGSKVTCLGLIPIAGGAIVWEAIRGRRPLAPALLRAGVVFLAPVAAWGWWFERNRAVYGDFLRKAAADRLWDPLQPGFAYLQAVNRETPAHYAQMLTTRSWLSFWGIFDGFTVMMPWFVYGLLAAFQAAALVGLLKLLAGGWARRRYVRRMFVLASAFYALSVAAVFYKFNWSHFSPQGRYYFVLLLPFGIVTALGWRELWCNATAKYRIAATAVLIGLLIVLNLWCLWAMPGR